MSAESPLDALFKGALILALLVMIVWGFVFPDTPVLPRGTTNKTIDDYADEYVPHLSRDRYMTTQEFLTREGPPVLKRSHCGGGAGSGGREAWIYMNQDGRFLEVSMHVPSPGHPRGSLGASPISWLDDWCAEQAREAVAQRKSSVRCCR